MKIPLKNTLFVEISCLINSFDYKLFSSIVWGTPDFPNSEFNLDSKNPNRFLFNFHKDDIESLLKKLEGRGEEFLLWANDIALISNEKFGTNYKVF